MLLPRRGHRAVVFSAVADDRRHLAQLAVAAIFAIHPLRAESVAWVSERKDLLSGLFFTLTLLAYAGYVRCPFSVWRYALVLVAFALGLLAKSMLVTVPLVLLLLDFWPLGRLSDIKPRSAIAPSAARSAIAPSAARSAIAPSTPAIGDRAVRCRRVFRRDEVAIDDRGFVPPGGRKGPASPACRGRRLDDPFRPRHDTVVQPDVLLAVPDRQRLDRLCRLPEPFFLPLGVGPRTARTACPVALGGSRVRRPIDCRHARGPRAAGADVPVGLGSARP